MIDNEIGVDLILTRVQASAARLAEIEAIPVVQKIPISQLDTKLSDLSGEQLLTMRQVLTRAGYNSAEVQGRFPDIRQYTVREVMSYLCERRATRRWDDETKQHVFDGPWRPTMMSIESMEKFEHPKARLMRQSIGRLSS